MAEKSAEYMVVARRYRPQTFDELIGQDHVARALKNAIAADRVGHAYLFTGARGVGKTSAARILAKALNCRQGPTPTPCNACDACQSIASGDDVDVQEIDGASNRGIDEIRQLRQNVGVRPSRVRFKVYIIDEVHMLTREAFNALLKTLEEPPSHVKFIFATTEPHKVPITILSRCQRFDFAGIDTAAIEQRLEQIAQEEGVEVEKEALALIARRAAGSMRDSQSLLEQLLAVAGGVVTAKDVHDLLGTAPVARVAEFAERLLSRDAPAALGLLDAAARDGTDLGQFWEQLSGLFRDMMVAAAGAPASQFLHALPSQEPEVRALADGFGIHQVLAILQILETTSARMRMSIDARTLTEMATVRICHLPDLQELADLIGHLEQAGEAGGAAASRPASVALKKNDSQPATAAASGTPAAPSASSTTAISEQAVAAPAPESDAEPVRATAPQVEHGSGESTWDDATAQRYWDEMRGAVEGMLGDYLARVERVTVKKGSRLVAWFPAKYALFRESCEQQDNRRRIEQGLSQVAGTNVSIEFDEIPNSEEAPVRPKSRREAVREVSQRPFVRRAVELFGEEVPDIRYIPADRGR